jgi:hypothetical protein
MPAPTLEFNELSSVQIDPLNNINVLVIGGAPVGPAAATPRVERGYRSSRPTLRDSFMGPSNRRRMREALLGMWVGDLFGKTPIRSSLRVFTLFCGVISPTSMKRSRDAFLRRATSIRPAQPEQMTAS